MDDFGEGCMKILGWSLFGVIVALAVLLTAFLGSDISQKIVYFVTR